MVPAPHHQVGPQELAARASGAARSHDVVVATSKLIHDSPLVPRDVESLRWAGAMLNRVLAAEPVVAVPSADELVAGDQTVPLLRRAQEQLDEEMRGALAQVSAATESAIAGQRDASTTAAAVALRELFSAMSRVALRSQVDAHASDPKSELWRRSMTSLTS